jgi:hypothetical protein
VPNICSFNTRFFYCFIYFRDFPSLQFLSCSLYLWVFLIAFVIFFNALRLLDSIDFSSYWSSGTKCLTHSCRLGFGIFKLIPALFLQHAWHTIRRFQKYTHVTEFRGFLQFIFLKILLYISINLQINRRILIGIRFTINSVSVVTVLSHLSFQLNFNRFYVWVKSDKLNETLLKSVAKLKPSYILSLTGLTTKR